MIVILKCLQARMKACMRGMQDVHLSVNLLPNTFMPERRMLPPLGRI